ncbi:MAG: hypothetical protein C5S49_00935 [Candidatus Methanogaster sp.]|nr:MAG: hypothetical protein C5S49_00935 [ANME-2 cluster archaeon]
MVEQIVLPLSTQSGTCKVNHVPESLSDAEKPLNSVNHPNIMKDAFECFRTNLVAIMANYEGEYIAIIEDNIVAHGRDAKKVYSSAKEKFPLRTVFLGQVPRKEVMIL